MADHKKRTFREAVEEIWADDCHGEKKWREKWGDLDVADAIISEVLRRVPGKKTISESLASAVYDSDEWNDNMHNIAYNTAITEMREVLK